jgi:hypothetical protein
MQVARITGGKIPIGSSMLGIAEPVFSDQVGVDVGMVAGFCFRGDLDRRSCASFISSMVREEKSDQHSTSLEGTGDADLPRRHE